MSQSNETTQEITVADLVAEIQALKAQVEARPGRKSKETPVAPDGSHVTSVYAAYVEAAEELRQAEENGTGARKDLGNVFRSLRESKGLSRSDLAKQLPGMSAGQVAMVEGYRAPTTDELETLSRHFGIVLSDEGDSETDDEQIEEAV